MTLTCEPDLDKIKVNHHANYVSQRSFCSTAIVQTHTHTHHTDSTIWTTKYSVKTKSVKTIESAKTIELTEAVNTAFCVLPTRWQNKKVLSTGQTANEAQ